MSVSKSGNTTTITVNNPDGTKTSQTVKDGTNGTPGKDGATGKTTYFHVKYSNDGGKTFTSNSGETVGDYIGTYTDFVEADSTLVSSYTWAKIKGAQGDKGATGAKGDIGPQGPQGVKGNDGKGIKSTSVTYQIWSNGTSTPTGTWSSTPPKTTADKPYLWTRTIITYTDGSTSPPSYSVGSTPEGVEEKVDKNIRDQIASSEKTIEESYKALINQTARDITGIVEKLQKETTDNSTTISQFSTNLKMTTDGLSVTKSAITTLKDAVNGKVDSNELKQYLDWDGDNLILSTSANKFKCMLSNTELGFYQGKTKVAWISNEELYVLKAIIAKSIGCGNFLFVDEGDLGFSLI